MAKYIKNWEELARVYIDDRAYKYDGQTMKEFIIENSGLLESEE